MRKIKIAIIGANENSHASPITDTLRNLTDVFEVVGYTLPENEEKKFPSIIEKSYLGLKKLTLNEILENKEIEAVAVETEEIYLTKYTTLCAKYGKHIHMEKPGGTSLCEFEEMISEVKKSGKVFHTGYMYRYNPVISDVLKRAKAGEFGEIISIEAQMNCPHKKEIRQWLEVFPGGMMFFLGCHLIDFIYNIQGEPENIIPLNRSTGHEGVTADDFGMVVLEYKRGVSFAKTTSAEKGGFWRRQIVICGTEKTIEIKPLEMYAEGEGVAPLTTSAKEYSTNDWGDEGKRYKSEAFDRYAPMMLGFAEMVRGEKVNPYTCDYELELYKLILKCCQ